MPNAVITWGSNTFNQDVIPYSLSKAGADLSQVFWLQLATDPGAAGTQPTNEMYTAGAQVGNFFNILSAVDVNKISAGLGHSAALASQQPTHTKPAYIYEFDVSNIYKTIIYDRYKDSCYNLQQIKVHKDEFVSNWVINKCLTKLVYNHVLLYNNLHSQFTFVRDDYGTPTYKDVEYNVKMPKIFKDINFDKPNNMFVGINEGVVCETLNRPLEEIYHMQQALIELCRDKYVDVYPKKTKVLDMSKNEYI